MMQKVKLWPLCTGEF